MIFIEGVAMEGLNELFQNLYGVELVVETPEEGELWSGLRSRVATKILTLSGQSSPSWKDSSYWNQMQANLLWP